MGKNVFAVEKELQHKMKVMKNLCDFSKNFTNNTDYFDKLISIVKNNQTEHTVEELENFLINYESKLSLSKASYDDERITLYSVFENQYYDAKTLLDIINSTENIKYDIFYKKFQVLLTYCELMIKNEFTIQ